MNRRPILYGNAWIFFMTVLPKECMNGCHCSFFGTSVKSHLCCNTVGFKDIL